MYHYAANNPVRYVDPTGAFDWDTNTIEEGDTLSQIARKYGITVSEIAKLNGIQNVNLIFPGQVLEIIVNKEFKSITRKTDRSISWIWNAEGTACAFRLIF